MIGVALGLVFGACLIVFLGVILAISIGTFVWARIKKNRRLALGSGGISVFIGAVFLAVCALGLVSVWITFDLNSARLQVPTSREVQGVYSLTPDSIEWLKQQKGYVEMPDSRVVIDGQKIDCISIPDCVADELGEGHGKFWSGQGTWTFRTDEWGWRYWLEADLTVNSKNAIYANLFCVMPNDNLRVTLGDPDSDEYIYYRKR